MHSQNIISPEDQKVTFVELFFDLVFVFSVTQTVALLHHEPNWLVAGQAILVFWLVWWAWSQFTWALNAANTTHPLIELSTLAATGVAFFMAVSLPGAFLGQGLWFAIPYVLVRVIGLILYFWVASVNPRQRQAVRTFTLVSIGGLAAVLLGGIVGGTTQVWLWGFAIVLDIIAASVGGQQEGWNLHPEHFGERHALFVIIALGETLIVAAGGVTGADWTSDLLAVALLAVAITGGLWWVYFAKAKPALDHALESCQGKEQSMMARDVFSLIHFPMLCGIVAYAVVIEQALAHPGESLHLDGRLALAAGLALFVGGMALAVWRANRRLLLPRILLTAGMAIAILALTIPTLWSLVIALAGVMAIAVIEQRNAS